MQKDTKIAKKDKIETKKFNERDLHSLRVAYAFGDSPFKANLKTVFHENSSKATKGQNEWLQPDLVGVYFPFRDYKSETLEIQNHLSITSIKLFSFEMKISLNFGNLRQSYFQAVSNSSWANEGRWSMYTRSSATETSLPANPGVKNWKVYQVTISKNELRKYLEKQKIIKSLTNGF